jgi:hypothetical protein
MPSKICVLVRDSRGYPVEGLPVYLSGKYYSQSGLTNREGVIHFVAPLHEEIHVYIYNPIIREFTGQYLHVDRDKMDIELLYNLQVTARINEKEYIDFACKYCGDKIAYGDRAYIYYSDVSHYDCFHNNRKQNYISSLQELMDKLDGVEIDEAPHEEFIYDLLEELGFSIKEDVYVDLDMHPIAVYEAVKGTYQGKDLQLDMLAVYPAIYPDMNLTLAIYLFDTYRYYSLQRITFTPYKFAIVGWAEDREGVTKPSEFISILREIISSEMRIKGICG